MVFEWLAKAYRNISEPSKKDEDKLLEGLKASDEILIEAIDNQYKIVLAAFKNINDKGYSSRKNIKLLQNEVLLLQNLAFRYLKKAKNKELNLIVNAIKIIIEQINLALKMKTDDFSSTISEKFVLVPVQLIFIEEAIDNLREEFEVKEDSDVPLNEDESKIIIEAIHNKYDEICEMLFKSWEPKSFKNIYTPENIINHIFIPKKDLFKDEIYTKEELEKIRDKISIMQGLAKKASKTGKNQSLFHEIFDETELILEKIARLNILIKKDDKSKENNYSFQRSVFYELAKIRLVIRRISADDVY